VRKVVNQSAVVLFALSIGAGCASHTKTVRTQTVQYPAELEGQSAPVAADPVVVEKQTTTTTETQGESSGLLSGTVHVMGEILALPFRLVAGMISLMF